MIEIRLLGSADSLVLSNVAADVFDDTIIEASARDFLADPRHRLVVAMDDDLVVGFVSALIYLHPDKAAPELWIDEIGVAPTHQRQGIGKRLLQAILKYAREAGCKEAWVLTDRKNTAAMGMYESVGGFETLPDPTMFTFPL